MPDNVFKCKLCVHCNVTGYPNEKRFFKYPHIPGSMISENTFTDVEIKRDNFADVKWTVSTVRAEEDALLSVSGEEGGKGEVRISVTFKNPKTTTPSIYIYSVDAKAPSCIQKLPEGVGIDDIAEVVAHYKKDAKPIFGY